MTGKQLGLNLHWKKQTENEKMLQTQGTSLSQKGKALLVSQQKVWFNCFHTVVGKIKTQSESWNQQQWRSSFLQVGLQQMLLLSKQRMVPLDAQPIQSGKSQKQLETEQQSPLHYFKMVIKCLNISISNQFKTELKYEDPRVVVWQLTIWPENSPY